MTWGIQWVGRLLALLLAYLLVAAPPVTAHESPLHTTLGRACALASDGLERPEELIFSRSRFDCSKKAASIYGPVTWGLFDGLRASVEPHEPVQFRHTPHPFQSQQAFAGLANGQVIELQRTTPSGSLTLSSEIISYDLPTAGSPVVALLIREVGMQHQRGIATDALIIPAAEAAREDSRIILFFAVLGGIVFALLFFNLALYATLRYSFILTNCAGNAVICALTMTWAGDIIPFVPDVKLIDKISLMQFGIAIHFAFSALFMLSFIEREKLHRGAVWIVMVPAFFGIAAAAMRLVDVQYHWELVDLIFYAGLGIGTFANLLVAIDSLIRGSLAARIYLAALIVPASLGLARLVWGQQLTDQGGMFLVISPTLFMVMSALLNSLAVSWRISVLLAERNHAYVLAETDAMTRLFNRRAFVTRALVGDHPKKLVLIDIDRFKSINDNFGHQVGDEVIEHLADVLRATTPPGAVIGRLGGEEFAVLTEADTASGLSEAIRRAVVGSPFPKGLMVSVSIGTSLAIITNEQQWAEAYGAADAALYEAKRSGRNRVRQAVAA